MYWCYKAAVNWFCTATRHAFCREPCCRALVFCDCTPVCRMAVSAVAQGFCQLVLHSSTGQQGMQVTLYTAAMYWCYKAAVNWFCTATRHAFCREPCCRALVFCDCTPVCRMDVSAVAQGFCQLVLHSSTGQQGMQVPLYTAAMHWCYKAAVNWFCTATRHVFCREPCCRALVFCDCTPVCRMAVSAVAQGFCQLVLHSSTGQQGMQVPLYTAAMHWCYKAAVNWFCTATRHAFCREPCCRALVFCDCTPVCRMDVSAVAQGFCQLVLHSSTGQQGMRVPLYCSNALVFLGCCQLVLHSSTQQQGMHFALNSAAGHWCLMTTHLFAEWICIGLNAVA